MAWKSLNWIIFSTAAWLSFSVFIKFNKKRELFTVVFWMGIVLTTVLQIIGIHIFNWWYFPSDYFSIIGIPLTLIFGWIIGTILFITYYPAQPLGQFLYILIFSGITTLINYYFVINGFQVHNGWNFLYTFFLAVLVHLFEALMVMPFSGLMVNINEDEFIK